MCSRAPRAAELICATNVACGDLDGKSLYVTACGHVYRIRMKVAGVMPGPKR